MHCSIKKQLTVNVEDRPGMLAYVSKILADARVNIRDVSSSDFRKQGIIRIIPDDPPKCEAALRKEGLIPISVNVVSVLLPDNPGSLAKITAALATCDINIEYIYGTASPFEVWNAFSYFNWFTDRMRVVLKVSDTEKALQVISNLKRWK